MDAEVPACCRILWGLWPLSRLIIYIWILLVWLELFLIYLHFINFAQYSINVKLIRTTYHLYEIMLPKAIADFKVSVCTCAHVCLFVCFNTHWLMTCLWTRAHCEPWPSFFILARCKHFFFLACSQTKQQNNFFMIQPCCYCSSSLVTKLCLPLLSFNHTSLLSVKYSLVIHIHSRIRGLFRCPEMFTIKVQI